MKKVLLALIALLLLGLAGVGAYLHPVFWAPAVPASAPHSSFIIHRGMSVKQIADSLRQQAFIRNQKHFLLAAKLTGWSNQLKAGKYEITSGLTHVDLLRLFRSGKVVQVRVTLPEGKTAEDYAEIVARALQINKEEFLRLTEDSSFARKLGVAAPRLEGYLYPNTYQFYWGTTVAEVLTALVQELQKHLDENLRAQVQASGMTLHQIMTLASIIEGEAVVDSERTVISAVYRNRLRQGILLQADPTIQYAVPGPPRRLLFRDLEIDSPYNTYRYAGLPPGPVNNPRLESIRAALNPAPVQYIYFVARGDGSHRFSYTLDQHLQAKRDFDRVRAQVRREQRAKQKAQ
ncbi:MAG: endolytic transglycosylase MltG [candidate division KSB1 bacterium]